MDRMKKRLTALLLALVLLLGLAACGSGDKDSKNTEQLTSKVYVPEFMDFKLENIDYITCGCADESGIYLVCEKGQEREETDPDSGEVYYTYDYTSTLYRIPLDGGEAALLENYEMPKIPEGTEGNAGIQNISAGTDGTLWVTEYINSYTFNLPENFDENSDDRWNYQESSSSVVRRQLDGTGAELSRMDITDLASALDVDYVNGTTFDREGNVYATTESEIFVLDSQLNKLFSVKGEDLWGELTLLGDGSVGMIQYDYDEEKESGRMYMRTIDREAQDWGAEYSLPQNAYTAYTGGGDYLFYYQNGDSIYGYKAGAEGGEKIFSWIDSDINRNDMEFFSFLSDGRVVVVTREWNGEGMKVEAAIMTAVDRASLPEKTTLTYATMYLGYDTRTQIIDFNKTSDKYRIEVRDYSEFNTEDDASAGLTRLNTEIIAGNVPDMLETDSIPLRQYGARGLLEDLWPYIEGDPDLGRERVMEHVLTAAEQNGKLYEVFNNFAIRTVAGGRNIVGDRMSWSLADLKEALEKMPEGCAIFGQTDTKSDMLGTVMALNADSFVNWDTGECSFDGDGFKALLEFCNSFPAEFNWEEMQADMEWEDPSMRIVNGKQMLSAVYFSDLRWDMTQMDGIFKSQGGAAFVGYPREDGGVGSSFTTSRGVAMSSSCKDKEGAWSFMRRQLLPMEDATYYSGFYVNKADFEKGVEQAMTPEYELDENGNQVLDENGQPVEILNSWWVTEDLQIEQGAVTQEQYDRFMALYNAVDSVYYYDDNVFDIVNDAAGAYFSGDRSLDDTASQIQSRVKLYVNENR